MKIYKTVNKWIVCLGVVFIASGCGSNIKLEQPLALTEEAINDARSAGAEEYAPLPLDNAERKFEDAKVAIKNGEKSKAKRLLEEAESDAKLAESTTEAMKKQKAADELIEGNQTLLHELRK